MRPFRHRCYRAFCLLTFWVVTAGCGSGGNPRDSTSVPRTSEVTARLTVGSSRPNELSVSASLRQYINGQSDLIGFSGGEAIGATVDGVTRGLVNTGSTEFPFYRTSFVGVSTDSEVEIVFYRADNNHIVSRVEIGPDFEVTSPVAGEVLYWADDLVLRWTPGRERGRVMRIYVDVSCTRLPGTGTTSGRAFYLQIEDDGEFIYDLDNLSMSSSPDIDRSIDCTLDLDFRRESATLITPPYAQGSTLSSATLRAVEGMSIAFD